MKKVLMIALALLITLLVGCTEKDSTLRNNDEIKNNDIFLTDGEEPLNNEPNEYSAPSELGNDLTSFNVEIEGNLYRLPAPVSAFLDNGWEITKKEVDTIAANSNSSMSITITKNNKNCTVGLINYSDEVQTVEACYVYNINSKFYNILGEALCDIDPVLPGGVTIGTSESEMKDIYKSLLEKETLYNSLRIREDAETEERRIYEYAAAGGANYIQVYINRETNLINNIVMKNDIR